jgi:alpha-L-fucosidase
MRYVNFTTKHVGRMAMYRTATTESSSLNSPARRDLVAELAEACRERGLGLFLYVPPETARTDGEFFDLNRRILRELLTQYGPVAGIWFDGIGHYRRDPENYTRLSELFAAKPAEINTVMQECYNRDGIGEPGGWINDETARHLTPDEVMYLLGVARRLGANLLLNIGPRGDGSVHPLDRRALLEVGRRLRKERGRYRNCPGRAV